MAEQSKISYALPVLVAARAVQHAYHINSGTHVWIPGVSSAAIQSFWSNACYTILRPIHEMVKGAFEDGSMLLKEDPNISRNFYKVSLKDSHLLPRGIKFVIPAGLLFLETAVSIHKNHLRYQKKEINRQQLLGETVADAFSSAVAMAGGTIASAYTTSLVIFALTQTSVTLRRSLAFMAWLPFIAGAFFGIASSMIIHRTIREKGFHETMSGTFCSSLIFQHSLRIIDQTLPAPEFLRRRHLLLNCDLWHG